MRGGYRQNAGRKKGSSAKKAEEARKLLSERLAQEIEPIINILIAEAKRGNIRAIKELFDRAWGRAPQTPESMTINQKLPILEGIDINIRRDSFNVSKEATERFNLQK